MNYSHAARQHLQLLTIRYTLLRRFSYTTLILSLIWIYAVHRGERGVFNAHIAACDWQKWERWPSEATPHRMVFVADPQLVDPHTYPGRPWPLSTATEFYTDLYMARNFRLINSQLDPDSVLFLGDLLDGAREWAPDVARPLTQQQREWLEQMGKPKEEDQGGLVQRDIDHEENVSKQTIQKRTMESYNAAVNDPWRTGEVSKKDHFLDKNEKDLKAFVHMEDGRWRAWGQEQFDSEYFRFDRIFFGSEQLYPNADRRLFATHEVLADPVSIQNGAKDITTQQYATLGHRQRRVLVSLPGNHDVGFGTGVQLAIRDRFRAYFGEGNQINVLGNHTIISLDTLSLSAKSQFTAPDGETTEEQQAELEHIWKQPTDFLDDLRRPSGKAVADALSQYYPEEYWPEKWTHVVEDPLTAAARPSELSSKAELPVILLTHVPLFREHNVDCGPLREKGRALSIAMGYQYQNVLTQSLSNSVVSKVSEAGDIVHVFSGDDHDYCDVSHRYNVPRARGETRLSSTMRTIRETTVKSFSWAMGVRQPGFLLVSLWNPVDHLGNSIGVSERTLQTQLCLLPDQLSIFINYALMLGVTIISLIIRALYIGLKNVDPYADPEDLFPLLPSRSSFPHLSSKDNGSANGYSTPKHTSSETKGRQRASSTSTSVKHNHNGANGKTHLGVQRSYNARTRSVSPAQGYSLPNIQSSSTGGLVDKAGYYPPVRWGDPSDVDSDEESHIGDEPDSQAKWKWKKRTVKGKGRRVLDEFVAGVLFISGPVMLYYSWLIRHG
ncbi:Hypothetical protein R9X50_00520600 [Acrodontium crateriforme]|uniref:Calcineurin-like phosphoesterase domain-containing protein n=1 Tax=Acrodontium crateriforme TaxID=150365 RepID=A0AAQ3M721_9PEZI|nr:Hypothetical protein R9X50_00520600 [Acrodontium crateriforme]